MIAARLGAVEEGLSSLRDELLPSLDPQPSAQQVSHYIATVENDCRVVADDVLSLYHGQDMPWITIDFCELAICALWAGPIL